MLPPSFSSNISSNISDTHLTIMHERITMLHAARFLASAAEPTLPTTHIGKRKKKR